jgi:hypothetical protein
MRAASSRKLSERESKKIRKALFEKWNFSFEEEILFVDVAAHEVVNVQKSNLLETDYDQIIQIISLYTAKVFELPKNGNDMERPVMSFHPDSCDTVFCDDTFSWIIYASPYGVITFGGEWLIELITKIFPSRKDQIIKKKKMRGVRQ